MAMRILLTNDDGIDAPGLAALYKAARGLGDVTVVAPDSVQSAKSHAVTFHTSLTIKPHRVHAHGEVLFVGHAVSGTPADCVKVARARVSQEPWDLAISGINAGANLGIHTLYSGTVAAAREAAMTGIPAIAMSLHLGQRDLTNWDLAAEWAQEILKRVVSQGVGAGCVMNINLPITDLGHEPLGVRVVPASVSPMVDTYEAVHGEEEEHPRYHAKDHLSFREREAGSDVEALFQRYITVTPLHFDLTWHERLAQLKAHLDK
jgi:5'-nucleotidase